VHSAVIDTPIGPLGLDVTDEFVVGVRFRAPGRPRRPDKGLLAEMTRQLGAYFDGRLRTFSLPLAPVGTAFQTEVWRTLGTIPYGQTWTYTELAERIGRPAAVRAVGAANGRNPIPIIIPCHRVIGSSGKLVGFGGGLETKRALLGLEQGTLF
jgi:methylated-DNA-[protein]-cysteine S-methyltransferase